jgi:hypothetical protein
MPTSKSHRITALAAPLGWSFGKNDRTTMLAGYRYMQIELDEADAQADVETELTLSGPIVGISFRF